MKKAILALILSFSLITPSLAGEFADSAAGIEEQLSTIESNIQTLNTNITNLSNRVDQLPTNLDDIQASLNSLSASVDSLTAQIDVLLANDVEIKNTTASLQERVTQMDIGLGDLSDAIQALNDEITDHETNHPSGGDDGTPNVLPIQPLVLSPTDDAYVRGGIHSDSNFGSSSNLIVKNRTEGDFIRYAFLKFDLSGIRRPVDSTLLRIYAHSIQQDITIELYEATGNPSWTEDTITWNTKPNLGNQIAVSLPLSVTQYVVWDITQYINDRPFQNQFSFALVATGDASNSRNDFYSKESLINQPEISFVWQEQGAFIDTGNCGLYTGQRVEDLRNGWTGTVTGKKCLTIAMIGQWHSKFGDRNNSGWQTINWDNKNLREGLTLPWARPIGIYRVAWDSGTKKPDGTVPYGGNNGYNLCPIGMCKEECTYKSYDDNRIHKFSDRCRGPRPHLWTPQRAVYIAEHIPTGIPYSPEPDDPIGPIAGCPDGAFSLPGKIQAEDYTAFFDTSPGNNGNSTYRNDDVDIKDDGFGTRQIGWVKDGEWLEYPICNTKPGVYQTWFRVSCGVAACGEINMYIDNVFSGKITVPPTGQWHVLSRITFQGPNVIGPNVSKLKLVFGGGKPLDLDWIEFIFTKEHSNWPS